MKTSSIQKTTGAVEMTESETDHVAGGAPTGDPGNAYGGGRGLGNPDNPNGNNGRGQGWWRNDQSGHGRF